MDSCSKTKPHSTEEGLFNELISWIRFVGRMINIQMYWTDCPVGPGWGATDLALVHTIRIWIFFWTEVFFLYFGLLSTHKLHVLVTRKLHYLKHFTRGSEFSIPACHQQTESERVQFAIPFVGGLAGVSELGCCAFCDAASTAFWKEVVSDFTCIEGGMS